MPGELSGSFVNKMSKAMFQGNAFENYFWLSGIPGFCSAWSVTCSNGECQWKLHPGAAQARGTGDVSQSPPAATGSCSYTNLCQKWQSSWLGGVMRVGGIQHHLTWNENTNKPLFLALAFQDLLKVREGSFWIEQKKVMIKLQNSPRIKSNMDCLSVLRIKT